MLYNFLRATDGIDRTLLKEKGMMGVFLVLRIERHTIAIGCSIIIHLKITENAIRIGSFTESNYTLT